MWDAPLSARSRNSRRFGVGSQRRGPRGSKLSTIRTALLALLLALASACGGGGSGGGHHLSDAFRSAFMQQCIASSAGQRVYCQCALDYLEAHASSDTDATNFEAAAVTACRDKISP